MATAGDGPAEIVTDERVGRTFASGDVADLARALVEAVGLAADPSTPPACRQHAARWGWAEAAGPRHEEVYERVAGVAQGGRAGLASKRAWRSAMPWTRWRPET